MKVLVTGATGFIGSHLIKRLVGDGHTVVALVRSSAKASSLPKVGVELLQGDLSIFEDRRTVLPACDAVVHLAGVVAAEDPADYDRINHRAVRHLVACLERQTWRPHRLLFASSLAAAGPTRDGTPKSETDPCEPVEPYGRSKRDAEEFLHTVTIPTTTFRPPLVLGDNDSATITLYKMAKRGIGFRVLGGVPKLSFIDVEDLASALVLLLGDRTTAHRTYFISHPTPTDPTALWKSLGKALNRRVVVIPVPRQALYGSMRVMTVLAKRFKFRNQLDEKQYEQLTAPPFVCSSDALQRDLGWRPVFDLDASVAKAAAGFRKSRWL